uniref:Uncharacterized protein n=1 Tax=Guillardia theta TaxID=55529 RepID=A0A7S4P6A9_GUITH|mmetsp:Transcript_44170/g.139353  ORF Transcript_44170/g.139353 Transcript_44170/m.139353 type:complete len:242 (+) Transcript_44170:117-842(+)
MKGASREREATHAPSVASIHARVPDVRLLEETSIDDDDRSSQASPSHSHSTRDSPRQAVNILIDAQDFGSSPFKLHFDFSDDQVQQDKKPQQLTRKPMSSLDLTRTTFSSFNEEEDSYRWYRRSGWRTQRLKLFNMPMNPMNSSYARLAEHVWSKASSHVSLHAGDYLLDKVSAERDAMSDEGARNASRELTAVLLHDQGSEEARLLILLGPRHGRQQRSGTMSNLLRQKNRQARSGCARS